MDSPIYPELGCYALPGHVSEPKNIFAEVAAGDRVGLGSMWISERLNTKDIGVLSGIAAAKTSRMAIASGLLANMPLRHPLVTAGYASTMMKVTDDRFALGVGRGFGYLADAAGVLRSSFRVMEDYFMVMRKLWRGESVGYSGPLGTFSGMMLGTTLETPPPIIMAVMGEKTCYWAGKHCDGVLLNALWGPTAVRNSARLVHQGAIDAGRDPKSVKIWTIMVTACDVSEEIMLTTVIRRMNTYLLAREIIGFRCDVNGWDRSVAEKLQNELKKLDVGPQAGMHQDEHTTRDLDHLRHMRDLYPQQWIDEGVAVGSARECVQKALNRFDAGADGILFHGTHPANLQSFMDIWPQHRPAGIFDDRSVNPGL